MFTLRIVFLFLALTVANGAFAVEKPFTGVFQGTGRQCYGKLYVRTKTIEWHTPFAACKKTPYKIVKKKLNAPKPEIVFLLKGKQCDFGVISLDWDPEYPDYWNATGYRSLADYEKGSEDKLRCNMEKVDK